MSFDAATAIHPVDRLLFLPAAVVATLDAHSSSSDKNSATCQQGPHQQETLRDPAALDMNSSYRKCGCLNEAPTWWSKQLHLTFYPIFF
jgi:hypothetical protein